MSLVDQAKALLELAAKRTRTGPLRQGHTEPFAVWIKDPNALGGHTLGERLLLRFNQHIPFADDAAYLVAAWDLAEVLAREYISQSETLRCCAKALGRAELRAYDAEDTARALMDAGREAVEQARREERARCAAVAESVKNGSDDGWVVWAAQEVSRRIRARGR